MYMSLEQHNLLTKQRVINAADLSDKTPRTLLLAPDGGRLFHVYLGEDGKLYRLIALHRRPGERLPVVEISSGFGDIVRSNSEFVPSGKIEAASSDGEFCSLLQRTGARISVGPYYPSMYEHYAKQHGKYQAHVYDARDSDFYISADSALLGLISEHQGQLLKEAADSLQCETRKDGESRVYCRIDDIALLRQKAKLMLSDPLVANAIGQRNSSDLNSLLTLCLKLPVNSYEVRKSTLHGGSVLHHVSMNWNNIELIRAAKIKSSDFQKTYGFSIIHEEISDSRYSVLTGPGRDGKAGLAIFFSNNREHEFMVLDRIFGDETTFLTRVRNVIDNYLEYI